MNMKLIQLSEEMIDQTAGFNTIAPEQREEIKQYIGMFGTEIDDLIQKFISINVAVSNGGSPILKQIIDKMNHYEVSLAKETACLMLKYGSELIDYQFINKYQFDNNMTNGELMEQAEQLARKNNIQECFINLN